MSGAWFGDTDRCRKCYYLSVCNHAGKPNPACRFGKKKPKMAREAFACPKEFHGYHGYQICLECQKPLKYCEVYSRIALPEKALNLI